MDMTPWVLAIVTGLLFVCTAVPAPAAQTPRERVSLNADWRFQKDDPADANGELAYAKLKEYLVPAANEFRKFAAGTTRPARPTGNPGENVSYVRGDFD